MSKKSDPNRIGRRAVEPRGYVLVYVGEDHHLADCRGYAYEHRLIAEKKLGRRLLLGELVHHDDEVRNNNEEFNLDAMTRADHVRLHKPRLGTASPFCQRGHAKHIQRGGKSVCRVCENTAERARYHLKKEIVMGTKNNPGAWDCYATALPDEPMFILLGRDPHAAAAVMKWADDREIMIRMGQKPESDMAMVYEARECARAMGTFCKERNWRRENHYP